MFFIVECLFPIVYLYLDCVGHCKENFEECSSRTNFSVPTLPMFIKLPHVSIKNKNYSMFLKIKKIKNYQVAIKKKKKLSKKKSLITCTKPCNKANLYISLFYILRGFRKLIITSKNVKIPLI